MTLRSLIARRVAFPLKEVLTRKRSIEALAELERTQWLPPEEIRALQWERLGRLLRHAAETVPYYRGLFRRMGLAPGDVRGPEDYARWIPLCSKKTIQAEGPSLLSEQPGPHPMKSRTSGSTGTPMTVWSDSLSASYGYAAGLRGRRWWGVEVCASELKFWGISAPFEPSLRGRALSLAKWAKDWLLGTLVISPFDLSGENLRRIHRLIRGQRPELIFGYGAAIFILAKYLRDSGASLGGWRPRAVIYTSETLQESQKDLIREVFGAPVVCEYGCVEAGALGYECEAGRIHLSEEIACFEFLPASGEAGRLYHEVVITPLLNFTFPLLRYRLGDLVEGPAEGCACGRGLRTVRRIIGRDNDLVRKPDGQPVHAELFDYIMRLQPGVGRYRIVQRRVNQLDVMLELEGGLAPEQEARLQETLARHVGGEFSFRIQAVGRIPSEPSGKFRWVVSKLPPA